MSGLEWMSPATALKHDRYSASSTDEEALLRDFVRQFGSRFDQVAFNVRLGEGYGADRDDNAVVARMWKAVTQVRADMVARQGADLLVIEAKFHGRIQASTQVQRYVELAKQEFRDVGLVVGVVICRSCDTALEVAMHARGGRVIQLPRFVA